MKALNGLLRVPSCRIAAISLLVLALDQVTKRMVIHYLGHGEEKVVVDGFFKLVYWGNTGAAWSLFRGNNALLAIIALAALLVLFLTRHHFASHTHAGQVALGLIFGGIVGNLIDRLRVEHVIDFLYFYVQPRGHEEIGFPAFNIADMAICIGVAMILLISWRSDTQSKSATSIPGNNSHNPLNPKSAADKT